MEEEQYVLPDQTDPPLALLDEEKRKEVNNFRDIFKNDESLNEEQRDYVDEYVAYRYLKARDWDVDLAEQMLRGTLKWRAEFKPHKITAKDVESQIRAGHMYQEGFDKYKRPVIFLKVHTEEDPHSELEKLQFMIHCMEVASNVMDKERGVEKMVWVCSCLGYNMKYNGAVGFAREILNILQNHYPERLGALFCFDAPWIFRCFWKVVSPFVDSKTLKKIFFVQGSIKERQEVLEPFFDLDELQKDFGGNKEWEFDADAYFDRLIEDEKKATKKDGNGEEKKTKKKKKDKKEKKKKKKEEEGKEENSQNGNDEESD